MAQGLARRVFGAILGLVAFSTVCVLLGAYYPASPDIDLGALGAIGNGTFINNTQFATAFSMASHGGKIKIPCGVYKLTQTPTVTVAAGAHIELAGSGSDCAVIFMSGAVNGPTLNLASQWSSFGAHDLTVESDQTGGTSCLVANGAFTNGLPATASSNSLENVTFRGTDTFSGSPTRYCGVGFDETNVSNISIINENYSGTVPQTGIPVNLHGTGTNNQSVQINILNSNFNNCTTGVVYGDYVQGVQMLNSNITGCSNGVIATAGANIQAGFLFTNNQMATTSCGICINNVGFPNAQILNNQFIIYPNSIGVKIQGTNYIVSGNELDGTISATADGIVIGTTFGNGGSIIGNHLIFFAAAIQGNAANATLAKIDSNHFTANTVDYSLSGAASTASFGINDTQQRNFSTLPTCNGPMKYSSFTIADSPTAVFNATVTVGGGSNYVGVKCDGSRYYVD